MSRMGILLACEHYPAVSENVNEIGAQLRLWLAECGTHVDALEVFAADKGDTPRHAGGCDAWIVSGVPLSALLDDAICAHANKQFLRAAASFGRPIYALNHGEHLVHSALAAFNATPPSTLPTPRAIRNPFRNFQSGDRLFRFNPATLCVEALTRPDSLCRGGMFGFLRWAA